MIEESRLARNFKEGDNKKVSTNNKTYAHIVPMLSQKINAQVNEDLISQASQNRDQLRALLSRLQSSVNVFGSADAALVDRSKAAQLALSDMIQTTDDPIRIEELLLLNDDIQSALKEIEDARSTPAVSPEVPSTVPAAQGGDAVTQPGNANAALKTMQSKLNGLRLHIPPMAAVANVQVENTATTTAGEETEGETRVEEEEAEELSTPRVDKGKGRAAPEPIVHEKVLTPTHVLLDSEDEEGDERKEYFDADAGEEEEAGVKSPTDL